MAHTLGLKSTSSVACCSLARLEDVRVLAERVHVILSCYYRFSRINFYNTTVYIHNDNDVAAANEAQIHHLC